MNTQARNHIELSMFTIMLLALLGVPRVIAHDLQWVDPHGFINRSLVFIPRSSGFFMYLVSGIALNILLFP